MGGQPLTRGQGGNGMVGPVDIGAAINEIHFIVHKMLRMK